MGHISAVDATVEYLSGKWTVFDQPGIGGMSGGAIVDTDGKVVSVTQMSDRSQVGLGRGIGEIYAATKAFWKGAR